MGNKKRAIIIVIDSMGIGAMNDCAEFGDIKECNTLKNVCERTKSSCLRENGIG